MGYPYDLARVVINVVDNAFHAVAARQGEAEKNYAPQVTISSAVVEGNVQLTIEDNGIGIKAADLSLVFDPYYTKKSVDEGTGLGLAISHDIVVNQHKGTIEVTSEPRTFTRVRIKLPQRGGDGS